MHHLNSSERKRDDAERQRCQLEITQDIGCNLRFFCPPPTPHLGFAYPGGVKTRCQFSVFASSSRSLHTQLAWSQVLFSNTLSLLLASQEGGEN